jgi:hypothetical protein
MVLRPTLNETLEPGFRISFSGDKGVGAFRGVFFGGVGMSATKLFCLKKEGLFVSWDGKSMTERPSRAGRFSKTCCQRKYPGYEMITFPEAYDQWHTERKARSEVTQ